MIILASILLLISYLKRKSDWTSITFGIANLLFFIYNWFHINEKFFAFVCLILLICNIIDFKKNIYNLKNETKI